MLLRHRPAPRSLALPRLHTLRRPQLPPRSAPIQSHDASASGRRPLATRPKLAPWRRKTASTGLGPVAHRPLATAVDEPMRQDDTPFVDHLHPHHVPSTYGKPHSPRPLYHLQAFDPATTLQLKMQDDILPRSRISNHGVPGSIDEMLSVFDACVEVNQLERAGLVLERFGSMGSLPHDELIALHNQYLRAGIARALEQPQSQWAQSLHEWFEVQIQKKLKHIPQTPETIACMLKISLLSAQGPWLDTLVTRYLDMLPEESIWSVFDTGVLNQQDFGTITRIYRPAWDLAMDDSDSAMGASQVNEVQETETSPSRDLNARAEDRPVPEVLAVPQKGLGLKTLRGVLSFFNQIEGVDLSKCSLDERREIQVRLERDCVEAAIHRWREESQALAKISRTSVLSNSALNSQLYAWQSALEHKLEKEFALFEKSETREKKTAEDLERCLYAPFMRQSTPARLAAVTIMGVLNALAQNGADKGVPLATLLTGLSKLIEEDVKFQIRQKKAKDLRKERLQRRKSPSQPATTQPSSHIIEAPTYDNTSWPATIKAKLGAQLLSALLDAAKIELVREHPETKEFVSQIQPALARTTIHSKGRRIGTIMPNKGLVELMKREPPGNYLARHLPMLVEPQPWTKFDRGGFLEFPSQLVRVKNGERDQRIYAEAASQRGDLDQVSKGLDVLGRTAWQINRPVFDVLLEAWNTGEKIANIPPLNPDIPIPEEPGTSEDPKARKEWLRRVRMIENEKSGLHSERCFMNFQLDIARAFRDQTFYFPHNVDFRGRAYPIPAYLNHMGADHVRGLLRFAAGKELGQNGLRWLKVQLANVAGFDKASLEEREAFAMDHWQDILDSATSPLTGQRWWLKAEDPWQCLAACFELKAALESPDPTKFVSHLPVHQDGTCNGLQHYAALGGDRWGAEQVNLLPGDRPADVYSAVAELVKESISKDLAAGNFMAKAVDGKITRKVVKQTVMTNVYGVTFAGAKAQVLKQLDAAHPGIEAETGVPAIVLASYIASKIFGGLSTMFRGAHDIQYWLGECAGRICCALTPEQLDRIAEEYSQNPPSSKAVLYWRSKAPSLVALLNQFRSTIVWTTPLRMPIVQPYRKSGNRIIQTCLQDLTLQIPERSDPVNRRKQLQAFPPNFIHSLDASHMLLSALECDELGLSFAAVHDSFWTHAGDVDVMNRVLRDAFIRIHSEDVIGRLASEFKARYKGSLYLAKIVRHSKVEKEIAEFRSKNRHGLQTELLQERERQRLLASSDPEEVKKGLEMITPGSIYEKFSSSESLVVDDEMEGVDEDASSELAELGEEVAARVQKLIGVSHFEATLNGTGARSSIKAKTKPSVQPLIGIWLPLTFPAIPAKGDFDVSELKSSKYFFS
ncbi:DNA-directed RNA polymerase [Xylaria palmicola]|nr:DNA-directed RNA polymerase [Xylaria palmicola]